MKKKNILIAVSGGIAAYKICDLVSKLSRLDVNLEIMMTAHAKEFVAPATFEALIHKPVHSDMFHDEGRDAIPHINLAKWADLILCAPATANLIAKMTTGLADDLVSSTLLAATCPILICPAMNTHMLENPVTQRNLKIAAEFGWHILDPAYGRLACIDQGKGRLPETPELIEAIFSVLDQKSEDESLKVSDADEFKPLKTLKVLVSAGPTQEPLDPVRFISNHSSGKQGYAIAAQARDMGADVVLVSGPVSLDPLPDVKMVSIHSAIDMEKAVLKEAADADFIIMAAAVADYRPKASADQKIKKSDDHLIVEFVRNPDILKKLGETKTPSQVLCGFAMETQNLDENAREKLEKKNCDLLIANNLSTKGAGFQTDTNIVSLLKKDSIEHLPKMDKKELGKRILEEMLAIKKGEK